MQLNKEKNFISTVIYVYNQEEKIYEFLKKIDSILNENFERYEIICVNDASDDASAMEIKRFASEVKERVITILNMSYYQGLELSMNAGNDLAIGDFVYEFDYPCTPFPNELIMQIYQRTLNGYDIVSAAPKKIFRKASKLFYMLFNKASKTQYLLRTEAFRILSRRAINRVHSINRTLPYRKAVYANCGLKTDVLTFEAKEKISVQDKKETKNQREVAVDAIILYTDVAYRFAIAFSAFLMVVTAGIGIYAACVYIGGRPVAGWTTTILFLAFAFLGIFIILSIVIKYMIVILKLNFSRQKYLIESIEKLN